MDRSKYLTVSQLTKYLKLKFDRDPYLQTVYLTGELSNFRLRSGHQYFSLKDDQAVIDAVMFRSQFSKVKFTPEEGMKLCVTGHVGLYERSGRYQIYIDTMEPDGVGSLYLAFEQLKKKLNAEGLFSRPKKAVPLFPRRIAVVTSLNGAVIRDINTTVRRRYPIAQVVLFPTVVQGEKAAADIARQIKRAGERGDFDTLIIGRGGGSIEDLWPFNEEVVARAIADCPLPVISSVGHETDTTIADLVADQRAATPTAAAELATPQRLDNTLMLISDFQQRLYNTMRAQIDFEKKQLAKLTGSYIFQQPTRLYENYAQKVDQLTQQLRQQQERRLTNAANDVAQVYNRLLAYNPQRLVDQERLTVQQLAARLQTAAQSKTQQTAQQLQALTKQLHSLDPLKIMERGYTYVTRNGKVVNQAAQLNTGEPLLLHFADGEVTVTITDIKEKKNGK
ncbi:MAG: exodeoxyribonuclease VII large subunit [Limosilactobacillus oris]|jgi:exodeoxyribonuclease VII large subunit|uniref:exodeoxyribonuclease VII large subunit n=1 Tax=Limosilactobacillus oris TaxID=1632 RepID=UPI002431C411|nr:exodeoxyribonuclease VII large subunit [Limosilactobacillus oris]MCH3911527.1 exodeoxyribonuclease VII large subunit [Limosilactobacillus oris]MCH3938777.1 exodeoxyribonuclease VII large subunit [Limosilactobacillus oris]MCI1980095.1 exodeoxyribonuclease VII large subunit [Limosilactobacillus oris]MCI2043483.1 exodeoxyribonuclease VII large subunit [Limosilactobacillus oris]